MHARTSLTVAALTAALVQGSPARDGTLAVETLELPPLRLQGQPARAHTQGLELVGDKIFVTARREDVAPRRALLLRTDRTAQRWEVWDITPPRVAGAERELDHPGGLQSDGRRLWIPLAESRRGGRSLVRVFNLRDLRAGEPARAEFEFAVADHIGALAVARDRALVLGASWDTETVYVWDLQGRLQKRLTGADLEVRGLGVSSSAGRGPGLAVQDWKFDGARLFASGLARARAAGPPTATSRLLRFERFLGADFQSQALALPVVPGTELGREGMAIAGSRVCFLPEDLGATNRLYCVGTPELDGH